MSPSTHSSIPLRKLTLVFSFLTAAVFALMLLWLLDGAPVHAQAGTDILRVATTGSDAPGCGGETNPCYSVQYAVDLAQPGDEIRVASGVYNGVHLRAGVAQVVYLSKTLTIRGSYTTDDWETSDPENTPSILSARDDGRVFYITGTITPTIEGLRIIRGDATLLGGTPWATGDAGGGIYVYSATATISNCLIFDNVASEYTTGYGGGIYLRNSPSILRNNVIRYNLASTYDYGYGGGVRALNSDAVLVSNTVEGNTASDYSVGFGGGIYLRDSDATLRFNTIQYNLASTGHYGGGGGLRLWLSNGVLEYNTILSNTASTAANGDGGGLYLSYSGDTIQYNVVRGNIASTNDYGYGGGVCMDSSNATLRSNTIQANIASTTGEGYGGGLRLNGSDATLEANMIVSNTGTTANLASGTGGGLSLESSDATIRGNVVISNVAGMAGGGNGGGLCLHESHATLESNTILGNVAGRGGGGQGGGLHLYGSNATLENNTVQNNVGSTADYGLGGGLYLFGSRVILHRDVVLSNTATLSGTASGLGGGIFVSDCNPFTVTNELVAGNHASTRGSGFYFSNGMWMPSAGRLLHTTIADNGASGGSEQGVYLAGNTTLAFTNTLVAGHSVGISLTASSAVTLDYTLWHDNGTNVGGDGLVTSTHAITGDPAFVNPAAGNYHLGPGSAAIDAGMDAGVTVDIDGHPRPWPAGGGFDVGADEFGRWYVYLPVVLKE